MRKTYMDHAATTALDPRVFEVMLPYLKEYYGNASSVHSLGRKARFAVEESREIVAGCLGAEPGEIVFTSGGTEANNFALKGSLGDLLTSTAEHESVLRPAEALDRAGRAVRFVQPQSDGAVSAADVARLLDEHDGIDVVSFMHANNEIGTISPIPEIAEICRARGVRLHCDAVQSVGYGLIRPDEVEVDLMTISGHKFYGPKGVGVLFVRSGVDLEPLVEGGSQERRRRGGTENVAAVVGFAEALRLAVESADERRRHAEAMRNRLLKGVTGVLGERTVVNTPVETRPVAPHILSLAFPPVGGERVDGEMLLLNLDVEGVYASAGSACTSGAVEPSHVLTAIGLDPATASAAVRLSVGRDTTEQDVDYAVEKIERVARRMLSVSAAK